MEGRESILLGVVALAVAAAAIALSENGRPPAGYSVTLVNRDRVGIAGGRLQWSGESALPLPAIPPGGVRTFRLAFPGSGIYEGAYTLDVRWADVRVGERSAAFKGRGPAAADSLDVSRAALIRRGAVPDSGFRNLDAD